MQTAEQLAIRPGYSPGRLLETLPVRVLAQRRQDLAHRPLDARQVHAVRAVVRLILHRGMPRQAVS
jgi:hypothetical protein